MITLLSALEADAKHSYGLFVNRSFDPLGIKPPTSYLVDVHNFIYMVRASEELLLQCRYAPYGAYRIIKRWIDSKKLWPSIMTFAIVKRTSLAFSGCYRMQRRSGNQILDLLLSFSYFIRPSRLTLLPCKPVEENDENEISKSPPDGHI